MPSVDAVIDIRLADPDLDFWVDVRLRKVDGSWLAVADLASTPEIVVASRPDLALLLAHWPLGESIAPRLAKSAVKGIGFGLQMGTPIDAE